MWKHVVLYVLILLSITSNHVHAQQNEVLPKHVVLVIVPNLSFVEAQMLANMNEQLWKDAAFGAMNVRPNGPYSYLNNTVTLSVGEKAVGIEGWNGYEEGESFHEIDVREWLEQTGGHASDTMIYHPALNELNKKNEIHFGRLGRILEEHNVERMVYGHSDTGDERVRYGSLFVMNEDGNVNGALSDAVKRNPAAPFSMEMDVDYLIHNLSTKGTKPQLTVVEWGDLFRLFKQRPFTSEQHFHLQMQYSLERLNLFLSEIEQTVDEIWLMTPMMHTEAYKERQLLAPIFYWGKGPGFLTSATTRQSFLVSNLDFAPTIVDSFGIKRDWQGHVIVKEELGVNRTTFFRQIDHIVLIYKQRASVLSTYIICLVMALICAALFHFFGTKRGQTSQIIRLLLLSSLSSPVLFLVFAKWKLDAFLFVFVLLSTSIVAGYILLKLSKRPVFILGVITFLLITIDLFLQSPLMKRSYLGYDPIIGARYYGIGNEFAGVYIITALMVVYPILASKKRWVKWLCTLVMFMFLLFILGNNTLGTNAGATLSAAIAFSYLLYRLSEAKWTWKQGGVAFCGALILGLFLLYLLQLNGSTSHIGVAYERLLSGDIPYIFDLIKRKLTMNMKLFRYSNWTQLLVTSYLLGAIVIWRRQLQLGRRDHQLFLQTGVIASFALLFLNDSGVVAAATSMFCVISTYYFWLSFNMDQQKPVRK